MTKPEALTVPYEERLAAVVAARQAAETAQRYHDAEALRLAESVLRDLIAEKRQLVVVPSDSDNLSRT